MRKTKMDETDEEYNPKKINKKENVLDKLKSKKDSVLNDQSRTGIDYDRIKLRPKKKTNPKANKKETKDNKNKSKSPNPKEKLQRLKYNKKSSNPKPTKPKPNKTSKYR